MLENKKSPQEKELLQVLSGLSDSVSFCAHGEVETVIPGLIVEGVGEIGVPVSPEQCRGIIRQAAQAPFGRGEKTVVDTSVRKVWQLDPSQFRFENKQWDANIAEIVKTIQQDFGLEQKKSQGGTL